MTCPPYFFEALEMESWLVQLNENFQFSFCASDTKKLLFDGFTKEEKGRYQYLLARKQIPPENKFEFPITSSWELGWRQKESISEFAAPTHGRNKIVRDTFYRKNGVFNAPIPMSMIKS